MNHPSSSITSIDPTIIPLPISPSSSIGPTTISSSSSLIDPTTISSSSSIGPTTISSSSTIILDYTHRMTSTTIHPNQSQSFGPIISSPHVSNHHPAIHSESDPSDPDHHSIYPITPRPPNRPLEFKPEPQFGSDVDPLIDSCELDDNDNDSIHPTTHHPPSSPHLPDPDVEPDLDADIDGGLNTPSEFKFHSTQTLRPDDHHDRHHQQPSKLNRTDGHDNPINLWFADQPSLPAATQPDPNSTSPTNPLSDSSIHHHHSIHSTITPNHVQQSDLNLDTDEDDSDSSSDHNPESNDDHHSIRSSNSKSQPTHDLSPKPNPDQTGPNSLSPHPPDSNVNHSIHSTIPNSIPQIKPDSNLDDLDLKHTSDNLPHSNDNHSIHPITTVRSESYPDIDPTLDDSFHPTPSLHLSPHPNPPDDLLESHPITSHHYDLGHLSASNLPPMAHSPLSNHDPLTPRLSLEFQPDVDLALHHLYLSEPIIQSDNTPSPSPTQSDLSNELQCSLNSFPYSPDPYPNQPHLTLNQSQTAIFPPDNLVCLTPNGSSDSLILVNRSLSDEIHSSDPSSGACGPISPHSQLSISRNNSTSTSTTQRALKQLIIDPFQFCLTPADANFATSSAHPHSSTMMGIAKPIPPRITRAMTLPLPLLPISESGSGIRNRYPARNRYRSAPNIDPPDNGWSGLTSNRLSDRNVSSPRAHIPKTNIKPSPHSKSNTSHFTRSFVSSKRPTLPMGRNSKFSLATAPMNDVVLVPFNGQRVDVAPITNVSMMPLYLVQPFLSPNSVITRSNPATPHSSMAGSSPDLVPSLLNRPSFPLTPSPIARSFDAHQNGLVFHPQTLRNQTIKFTQPIGKWIKTKLVTTSGLNGLDGPSRRRESIKRGPSLTQAEKVLIFSDHYCCFAIPLYNAGIYLILAQFTIFGFVFGILSFSAPSILAIAIDFAFTALFGVLCLCIGLVQAVGFYGVFKEKPDMFKKYTIGNMVLLTLSLLYCLILLIVSFTRHEMAIEQCLAQFISGDELNDGPSNTSRQFCSLWTHTQLGVCVFVWFIFLLSELYFCYLVRVWGRDQKLDHMKYQSIVSAARQSMAAASNFGSSGLADENDWESHSRAGSLDIREELNKGGRTGHGGTPLLNGGSRLKNEVEWNNDGEFDEQNKQYSKGNKAEINGLEEVEEEVMLTEQDPLDSFRNSASIPFSNSKLLPSQPSIIDKNSPIRLKSASGNWIESIDVNHSQQSSHLTRPQLESQPTIFSSSRQQSSSFSHLGHLKQSSSSSSSPPLEYSRSQQLLDDHEYYKSKRT